MKKLLLVGALLALGATAFGATPSLSDLEDKKTSANVEVRAEITDDFFIISDIYGKPIVVDFGKIHNTQEQSAVTFVDYKVTSKEAITEGDINFDITLGKKASANQPTPVKISSNLGDKSNAMTAYVVLSEYEGLIEKGEREYRGRINGTLAQTEFNGKPVGVYTGNTELEITVNNNK